MTPANRRRLREIAVELKKCADANTEAAETVLRILESQQKLNIVAIDCTFRPEVNS